jgi:hypothetical protein
MIAKAKWNHARRQHSGFLLPRRLVKGRALQGTTAAPDPPRSP